ncbi:aldolase/citrate lyase family protein [Methylopila sp. M107]|uniref:aldolase/citrate lyase family protein n=1 Tax=Methylopila sp. M107 TaxID=1101190 RepID=UPI0003713B1D|nr:aldolase/citrate lyase family protein [Methylopila sp. M107]
MALRSILTQSATDAPQAERAGAADVVMLDLQSGPTATVAELLRHADRQRRGAQIWLRTHPLDDARLADELASLCPFAPDAIVLPRAESAADVEHLGALLAVREAEAGLPDGSLGIVALVETAGALFEMHRIARASARLIALGWDGEALAADLGAEEDRDIGGRWIDPLQTARTLALAACADAKLPAIDSRFTGADAASFREEAARAARDGFAGKFAVTTEQARIAGEVFAARG